MCRSVFKRKDSELDLMFGRFSLFTVGFFFVCSVGTSSRGVGFFFCGGVGFSIRGAGFLVGWFSNSRGRLLGGRVS